MHLNGLETSELRTAEGSHRTLQRTLRATNSNHNLSNTNLHHSKTSPMPRIAECESPSHKNSTALQTDLEAAKRKLLVKNKEGIFLYPAFDCGKSFSGVKLAVYEVKNVETICICFVVIKLERFCIMCDKGLSLIHICRCRRLLTCRSRWSPYH
eukprot:TRINITY_DN17079_c0_g1_i1.p1 TRINITY_DN17079_c0_g1~~TRINITY_DN17079_c0_g1_i1.p1  ORF type:complete len:154 (+),score=9.54 TRINITY_DN17079_c0_g1_i1:98-559(+)